MMFESLNPANRLNDNHRILIIHKSNITKSDDLVDEALPILSVIQRLTRYTLTDEEIANAKEEDLLEAYNGACILLIDDLKNKKSTLKVNLKALGGIDKQSFLSALEKHEFVEFKDMSSWDRLANTLSPYLITLNSLEKFADSRGLISCRSSLMSNSQKASQARALITNILKAIPKEEREILEKVAIGQKGLKSAVRERISSQQFRDLFDSKNKNFQNRWGDVLKKQKSKE